jgi:F420-non-reducing hydrogenase iron-sulfur subunit
MDEKEHEAKVIAFLCNWCSYAGADLAGVSRLNLPPNIRNIRVMCSGRVNPIWILKAFLGGADGVLVAGCHPRDCHYQRGNMFTRRRFVLLKDMFDTLGLEGERVRVSWISASEGIKYSEVVREFTESLNRMGPNPASAEIFL